MLEGLKEVQGTSKISMARSPVVPGAGQTLVRVASFSDHSVSGVSGSATPIEIGGSSSAPNHPWFSEDQKKQFSLLIDEYEGIIAINNSDLV